MIVFATLLIVLIFLIICIRDSSTLLFTPQFGLIVGFFMSVFGALMCIEEWQFEMSYITHFVIVCGLGTFLLTSTLMRILLKTNHTYNKVVTQKQEQLVKLNRKRLIVFTVFQVLVLIAVIRYLLASEGVAVLSEAIGIRKTRSFEREEVRALPFLLRISRSTCVYSGYFFAYLFSKSIVNNIYYKYRLIFLINLICAMVNSVITNGSRGAIIQMIMAFTVTLLTEYTFKTHSSFSGKNLVIIIAVAVFLLFSFGKLSSLLGRGNVSDTSDYLLMYLSGSIYNLDYYLKHFRVADPGSIYAIRAPMLYIARMFSNAPMIKEVYYGFLRANGHRTGNVYTLFSAYYHDGRVVGVIFFTMIMAIWGQILLSNLLKKEIEGGINIFLIIYSYSYMYFFAGFFSEWMYLNFLSDSFIKFIITLLLLKKILVKENVKKRV